MVREENILISNEKALTTLVNKYFINITAEFDLKKWQWNSFWYPKQSEWYIGKIPYPSKHFEDSAFNTSDKFSFMR